ncbi:MAG: hypothetical protein P4M14_03415 [Gammaproteobacteria bacterium]|nr:hypothetical protein [Gammaproteobacteria bacterium]
MPPLSDGKSNSDYFRRYDGAFKDADESPADTLSQPLLEESKSASVENALPNTNDRNRDVELSTISGGLLDAPARTAVVTPHRPLLALAQTPLDLQRERIRLERLNSRIDKMIALIKEEAKSNKSCAKKLYPCTVLMFLLGEVLLLLKFLQASAPDESPDALLRDRNLDIACKEQSNYTFTFREEFLCETALYLNSVVKMDEIEFFNIDKLSNVLPSVLLILLTLVGSITAYVFIQNGDSEESFRNFSELLQCRAQILFVDMDLFFDLDMPVSQGIHILSALKENNLRKYKELSPNSSLSVAPFYVPPVARDSQSAAVDDGERKETEVAISMRQGR